MMTTLHTFARPRRFRRPAAALAAAAFVLWPVAPAAAQSTGPAHAGYDPTAPIGGHYHEGLTGEQWLFVERSLKCPCGCTMDVHSCQFQMQCAYSPGWSQRIRQELEAGWSVEDIQAGFVEDYGTQVLMAPPAEGFNLLGYFLPAVTILAAGALLTLVARGNMKRAGPAPVREVANDDAERLRAEWQKLDEAERPDW
ncbi:MAG: cytochrome c-type biogenesis protein CcmH [Gemmatimonadales bacterium]